MFGVWDVHSKSKGRHTVSLAGLVSAKRRSSPRPPDQASEKHAFRSSLLHTSRLWPHCRLSVEEAIEPFQHRGHSCHQQSADGEKPDPLRRVEHCEKWIWIPLAEWPLVTPAGRRKAQKEGGGGGNVPSIILVAELDPEPVGESDCGAEANCRDGRDGPRRGEKEDVQNEEGRWDHVKANICRKCQ
jgi:hypothetical protein